MNGGVISRGGIIGAGEPSIVEAQFKCIRQARERWIIHQRADMRPQEARLA
jgi:hypothetical protein